MNIFEHFRSFDPIIECRYYAEEDTVLRQNKKRKLECEEAIIADKTRFGSARTSLMRYLRTKYGYDVANRALYRINKRRSEGYFKISK